MLRIALLACCLIFGWSLSAPAEEGPSAALGQSLFESTALGSNGKSCSTCHPGGQGLDNLASYDDTRLKTTINSCIQNALKGKKLNPQAQELDSLLAYLRSLEKK